MEFLVQGLESRVGRKQRARQLDAKCRGRRPDFRRFKNQIRASRPRPRSLHRRRQSHAFVHLLADALQLRHRFVEGQREVLRLKLRAGFRCIGQVDDPPDHLRLRLMRVPIPGPASARHERNQPQDRRDRQDRPPDRARFDRPRPVRRPPTDVANKGTDETGERLEKPGGGGRKAIHGS